MARGSKFGAGCAAVLAAALFAAAAGTANADDVVAKKKGKTLLLKGDADGNVVLLFDAGGGTHVGNRVRVHPGGTSTVNGSAADAEFDDVVNVKASLGDGNDTFHAETLALDGSVKVAMGAGDDTVTFVDSTIGGNVLISGSKGSLGCEFRTASVGRTLVVRGGSDNDAVTCTDLSVNNGNAVIALGSGTNGFGDTNGSYGLFFSGAGGPGFDSFSFEGSQIGEAARFSLGPGTNNFAMRGVQVGDAMLYTGGPDADTVDILGTSIGESAKFSLSAGDNHITFDLFDPTPDPGFQRTGVGGTLLVLAGSGNDTVDMNGTTGLGDKTFLKLASGNNTCNLLNTRFFDLSVSAGGGDDTVDVTGSTINGTAKYNLGGGTNTQP